MQKLIWTKVDHSVFDLAYKKYKWVEPGRESSGLPEWFSGKSLQSGYNY